MQTSLHTKRIRDGMVVGLMALTLLGSVPATSFAQTPSIADLQARILELQARIASLQTSGTTLSAYTWTQPLRLGATGEAVRELQRFLNRDPATQIAATGPGSPGNETSYYGPATAAAVSKFQVKYRADILTPSGLTNPTGIFGPATIAKANALRAAAVAPAPSNPTTPTPSNPDTEAPSPLQGEGELRRFDISDADKTDIQESASDAAIAEVTLEADNGDIRITRMDIALVADSGNTEKDPWDTFESVSIWVDGDKVAEKAIDRRTDYTNRAQGLVRLSGLDIIAEDGEPLDITIAASVQNQVDDAGTAANWTVAVTGIRYFDGDNVSTDDRTTGDLGDTASFTLVERGDGEELKFGLNRNNPEAATIVVDEDRRTNNVHIMSYDLEAIDADIELETLAVNIKTGTAAFADVVQAVRLQINGSTFRSESIVSTGSYSSTSVLTTFDIDGDITIDEGDVETVRVIVDLKPQASYANGETIMAQVTSAERDITEAEGSDDIEELTGTVVGKEHRLLARGIDADADEVSFSTRTQGQNDTTGLFTISFALTAIEGDYYINNLATTSASTSTGGIGFIVDGNPAAESLSAALASSADETNDGVFIIREGETETFTLNVTFDPAAAGIYRVGLTDIIYAEANDGVTNATALSVTPLNKFRTPYLPINN